jgi:hypothetical protein
MIKSMKVFVVYTSLLALALFLPSTGGLQSYAQDQEPPTDFFLLQCDEIKNQVNALLSSKGPVQKNLLDIKNMTFLTQLYNDKCSAGP